MFKLSVVKWSEIYTYFDPNTTKQTQEVIFIRKMQNQN